MTLTRDQRIRFERQTALPEIGEAGQERLLASKVLLVGVGGLGSPAGFYLAAAGVGTIGLVDGDTVSLGNLQRQIAHTHLGVGRPKVISAFSTFSRFAAGIEIRPYPVMLRQENAADIVSEYDFVVDATDDFESKFLLADVCHELGKPYSHAGISRFIGQTMTVIPGETTCFRCVFEAAPKSASAPQGPLGVVPGVIGAIQAAEAVKRIVGVGRLLTNCVLTFDALEMEFRKVPVRRRRLCLCQRSSRWGAVEAVDAFPTKYGGAA